ncbi:MAG: tetratricopeptide repeat protein [Bacteroidota bacterium]|jgi:TolA-binding protein
MNPGTYRNMMRLALCLAFLTGLRQPVFSQQQFAHYDPSKKYDQATELYVKQKYSAARNLFREFLEHAGNAPVHLRINAEYYSAISGAELFHPDAEAEIVAFISKYPESLKAKTAWFEAARVLYRQKKYSKAADYFEKTDLRYLSNEEIAEYYFKTGYSYFNTQDYNKASKNLSEILKVESKYRTAAIYYYAHVAYQNNNLNTANEYFRKLDSSETFGSLIPYYIIQIKYEQKKYDEAIEYFKTVEQREDIKNRAEIERYVAESYYGKGDYRQALTMFESFEKNYPRLSREDYYQLGFCHYQAGNHAKAVGYFEKSTAIRDAMQQTAYYNMADCFVKVNNKQAARNAFQFAARDTFDLKVREESLFAFAKLSFELQFQPVAINAMNELLASFPETKYKDEANEILAQLLITTRNYKEALASLDKIRARSPKANAAYQKVAYFRALELFNDRDYDKAIGLFNKAITNESDQMIRANAMYWKAEAIYNQGQYEAAKKQYRIFIFNPPSINSSLYNTANYNLGYCHFKLEDYAEANVWFRKYIKDRQQTTKDKHNDALIRTGDGCLMLKEYDNALNFYGQAIDGKAKSSDYALFQTGIIRGIRGEHAEKVKIMNKLVSSYPKSSYAAAANFEKGEALMAEGEFKQANDIYRKVIQDFPNSDFARKSLLKSALSLYNQKLDDQALAAYKDVVKKYPGSTESVAALTGIKNIYVSGGNPQGYFDYVKEVPSVTVSAGAQDSITYEAAEQLYLKGNHTQAAKSFEEYLKKFPEGSFALNAHFYKAESDYRNKDTDKALVGYLFVTEKPRGIFTEKSLLRAATILHAAKRHGEALPLFERLEGTADFRENVVEALVGQMRCHYQLKDYNNTRLFADRIINGDKVPNDLIREAHLLNGRSALATNDVISAEKEFAVLAKIPGSETGAEAKYNLAFIKFMAGNYKDSQKACFEVINQSPSYEYWIGKSFLLLGDNYLALNDTFQAKATYRSLEENYEKGPNDAEDIKSAATEKLRLLEQAEKDKMQKEIEEKERKYFGSENDTIQNLNEE